MTEGALFPALSRRHQLQEGRRGVAGGGFGGEVGAQELPELVEGDGGELVAFGVAGGGADADDFAAGDQGGAGEAGGGVEGGGPAVLGGGGGAADRLGGGVEEVGGGERGAGDGAAGELVGDGQGVHLLADHLEQRQ